MARSVLDIVEATGLEGREDTPSPALAHGLKQGLELAAATSVRPEMLLLDEPTAGLTSNERHVIGDVFRRLVEAGMTIVLIEHDLDFVARVADRVIVLHGGKVVESGTPAEVSESAVVREAYVGTAVHVKVDVGGSPRGLRLGDDPRGRRLRVPDHGALAIVGRNGMGKSTLLKAVMGYLKPSKGTVSVAGRDVTGWPTYRLTRLGVSYAAQEKSLFGELSVEENLSVGQGPPCPRGDPRRGDRLLPGARPAPRAEGGNAERRRAEDADAREGARRRCPTCSSSTRSATGSARR